MVSYYVDKFNGCCIVNGECFDNIVMIVVYLFLFFGILIEVINMCNGKKVVVWVNDCGFYIYVWVLDLLRNVVC